MSTQATFHRAVELLNDPDFVQATEYEMGFVRACMRRTIKNATAYLWHAAWSQARAEENPEIMHEMHADAMGRMYGYN